MMNVRQPLLCFLFLLGSSAAHSLHVPKKIKDKLDSIFPGTKIVEWTKEKGYFRANLNYNLRTESLSFDENARIMDWLEEIPFEKLPIAIAKKIESDFADYKTLIALQRINADPHYEIELMKGELHYVLEFNFKGRLTGLYKIYKDDPTIYID
jgi:hypothetical protein